jgi:hypothetical protein
MHVKIGQRLVEQDQRRLRDEAAGKRDPLALAAGQGGRTTGAKSVQSDRCKRVQYPPISLSRRDMSDFKRISHIFGNRHMRPQGIGLKDDADISPLRHLVITRR